MPSPFLSPVMTLLEYAKGLEEGGQRPYIEMFAQRSDVLQRIKWVPTNGGGMYVGYRQAALTQNLAFRALNAASTSGAGQVTSFQEATFRIDHDIPIDQAIIDRIGTRQVAWQNQLALATAAELWTQQFIKGDNTTTPTVFNGLQKRSAFSGRTIDNAAGVAGGAPLSLANLNQVMNRVNKPTSILIPWALKTRFIDAARAQAVGGYIIRNALNDIGKMVWMYGDLEIMWGYDISFNAPMIPFTEVAPGGGAAQCASIYVVSFEEIGVHGVQVKPLTVETVGMLEDRITFNTHVSWDVGIADDHVFSFCRLAGVTNAALVN